MKFAEKLKKAMQELNLNQRQVVTMTGKSKGSVSQYLSGKQIPSEDVQSAIATSLGLAYYNNTDLSDNDMNNINLINPSGEVTEKQADRMDGMDVINAYTAIVKENIDYDVLIQGCRLGDKEYIDEIVELMAETISFKRENMSIGNVEYPYQFVKNKLLKVESSHIQYVLECLHDNTTKIRNVRAYLLASIFNAPSTINHYYRAEVNHDMYGGGNL